VEGGKLELEVQVDIKEKSDDDIELCDSIKRPNLQIMDN
jgi:hypothetical protein